MDQLRTEAGYWKLEAGSPADALASTIQNRGSKS